MSKTTLALEALHFQHYAILALSRFGITGRQLNAILQLQLGLRRYFANITQLKNAGFITIEGSQYGFIKCTESGALVVEQAAQHDHTIDRLLTLAKLAEASDCSIYSILENAEQIIQSGLLCSMVA